MGVEAELARLREDFREQAQDTITWQREAARLREENARHEGNHVPDESLRERHSSINAERAKDVYKQGHDERCYICQQAEEIARLREEIKEILIQAQGPCDHATQRDTLLAALRKIGEWRFCEYVDVDPWTNEPQSTKGCYDRGREPCPYCRARAAISEVEECGDTITDRGDHHAQMTCHKPLGHRDAHAGDMATWTDGEHYDRIFEIEGEK